MQDDVTGWGTVALTLLVTSEKMSPPPKFIMYLPLVTRSLWVFLKHQVKNGTLQGSADLAQLQEFGAKGKPKFYQQKLFPLVWEE